MSNSLPAPVHAFAAGEFSSIAGSFAAAGYQVHMPARGILQLLMPESSQRHVRLLLSAGVHGDETAPVEMLADLLHKLAATPGALRVNLLLVIGNPSAIGQGRRFVEADMNRMFRAERGELASAAEAGRADAIMQATEQFFRDTNTEKWHFDLHTAIRPSLYPTFAVVPDVHLPARRQLLLGWLGRAGIGAAILSAPSAGTFSAYTASRFGAASATVELGQIGTFGGNDLSRFADTHEALDVFLRTGQPPVSRKLPDVFRIAQEVVKHSEVFRLMLDRDVMNFTALLPGTLIAEDGDFEYRVGPVTEHVIFPNPDVRVGLRAGLMVVRERSA